MDEQCEIAIRMINSTCESIVNKGKEQEQLTRNVALVPKVKKIIPIMPLDYRTVLFQTLYSLFDRNPEISHFKFSVQTVIKQQLVKDFIK